MKLEIKHLAGYLSYSLKVLDEEYGKTFEVCSYRQDSEEWMIYDDIDGSVEEYSRDILKPILHPLSDLTKEIEVNGEKFVPIVEIGKMFDFDNLERFELDDDIIEYGFSQHYADDSQGFSFGYFENGSFGLWCDEIDDSHPISEYCRLDVIQKLYEWHFDVYNLIENYLAIDINTLKIKKL